MTTENIKLVYGSMQVMHCPYAGGGLIKNHIRVIKFTKCF